MVTVDKVNRVDNVAKQVTINTGSVKITFILDAKGRLLEISRSSQSQILDNESLYISQADYRQATKTAGAILRKTKVPAI